MPSAHPRQIVSERQIHKENNGTQVSEFLKCTSCPPETASAYLSICGVGGFFFLNCVLENMEYLDAKFFFVVACNRRG
ncbi:hypothetical protein LIPSTDRAFT_295926 [Lipomyces starkeyi NRRL Y-11557]|uniref:Uncharacterized protein n=1 Tax=Lipomyces starkeyi NRRL Y-11557 TaxID=675824 RepID=A0A1E3Q5J4_LIPST|nr:hypothetical protein LIPSTDRAFT_295926 [Lipomyces starkeyi NRRL Y-11557]